MNAFVFIVRIIVGAIVGWLIGVFLTRVMFTFDNWRLERKTKKQLKKRTHLHSVA